MTRLQCFRLKNAMLFANWVSNLIGVLVVVLVVRRTPFFSTAESWTMARSVSNVFMPAAFLLPFLVTILYERPIRRFLTLEQRSVRPPEGLRALVEKRLLNEPFFLIALDFGIWCAASLIYAGAFYAWEGNLTRVHSTFMTNFHTGLITVTVAFFVFEWLLQRRIVPHFFPQGGLYTTPGTLRIRIPVRLGAMLLACNLVPMLAIAGSLRVPTDLSPDQELLLGRLQSGMTINAALFMGIGLWVTFLVSTNLTKPLGEIIRVLGAVRNGRFDVPVAVSTNDELGYTGDVINEMTQGLREREFIKETFGRYVSGEVRDEILSGRVTLDGELKHVTMLFADLRNFTPMVEAHPPKDVVKIINRYFSEMSEAIRGHGGLVLQFIGDEIEAVFGAPLPCPDHPVKAVAAALEMQERLSALNEALQAEGYPVLAHGIGIHTGEVLAGNIGSPERLSYALVGDTVNLASRLQGLNKELGTEILLSAATRAHLGEAFPLVPLPPAKVKGKRGEVEIFSLEEGQDSGVP